MLSKIEDTLSYNSKTDDMDDNGQTKSKPNSPDYILSAYALRKVPSKLLVEKIVDKMRKM